MGAPSPYDAQMDGQDRCLELALAVVPAQHALQVVLPECGMMVVVEHQDESATCHRCSHTRHLSVLRIRPTVLFVAILLLQVWRCLGSRDAFAWHQDSPSIGL
jgi:hypothetical protein